MPPPPFLAKHLPPSAARPRVLALDHAASVLLAREGVDLALTGSAQAAFASAALPFSEAAFDAIVAGQSPAASDLQALLRLLRPGGRLLALTAVADRADLLGCLERAAFIHLFAEEIPGVGVLVRGERPPQAARPVDRIAAAARAEGGGLRLLEPRTTDPAQAGRYLHLLIAQTPNKPAWRLAPGEQVAWRAAVGVGAEGQAAAPAFTALVKAVAFMQSAVLAAALHGVNKVGKFPAVAARDWPFALLIDPSFEDWRAGPWAAAWRWEGIDPGAAIRGEE